VGDGGWRSMVNSSRKKRRPVKSVSRLRDDRFELQPSAVQLGEDDEPFPWHGQRRRRVEVAGDGGQGGARGKSGAEASECAQRSGEMEEEFLCQPTNERISPGHVWQSGH
jgi:hypothetical protein